MGDGARFGVSVEYILQDEPLGLAHAVLTAESFLGESPFVMYLGDNLLQGGIVELVRSFREREPDALILLTPVQDPKSYGIASSLLPPMPSPAPPAASCGWWRSRASRRATSRSWGCTCSRPRFTMPRARSSPRGRGELEITYAIQHLLDAGMRVEPHIVQGWWKEHGRLQDMLEANRLVLDNQQARMDGELVDSQVEGRVVVEQGARLDACDREGPGDHRSAREPARLPTSAPTRRSARTAP